MTVHWRCSVAMVVAGWYLMTPLIDHDNGKVMVEAPLHFWTQDGSFDTAKGCDAQRGKDFQWMMNMERKESAKSDEQRERDDARSDAEFKWKPGTARKNRGIGLRAAEEAKCIATDDPRLKETR
jgi:hypothetical protein